MFGKFSLCVRHGSNNTDNIKGKTREEKRAKNMEQQRKEPKHSLTNQRKFYFITFSMSSQLPLKRQ